MKRADAKRIEASLLLQEDVFERSYISIISGLKHTDKKFLNDLKHSHTQVNSERMKEVRNLQKSLLAIVVVIQKLKHNIQDKKYIEEHDIDLIKKNLLSVEENISSFKNLIVEQLEVLQLDEKEIQQSINSLMQRSNDGLGTSSQPDSSSATTPMRLKAQPKIDSHFSEELHPNIQEFQLFVKNKGGHTGGWDTNDHLVFIRLFKKYHSTDLRTRALLDLMPDKTAEEIAEHESWYQDYIVLKEAHRKAIQEWRTEQSANKQAQKSQEPENSANDNLVLRTKAFSENKDPKIKEKIQQWKRNQEERRREELQQLQEKEREERNRWKKKVEYFEQQKQLLAQRKIQRENQAEAERQLKYGDMKHLHVLRQQVRQSRMPFKDFWEQDRQFLQKRMAQMKQLYSSNTPQSFSRSSSHSRVQVARDPARLLQPTAVWRAHTRRSLSMDSQKSPSDHRPLYIADIPHLATPKWREGLA